VEAARKLAGKMLKNGPVALAKAVQSINASDTVKRVCREAELFGELCETDDAKKVHPHFSRKKPSFKGK
jgi:enoyl-CoA hydratase